MKHLRPTYMLNNTNANFGSKIFQLPFYFFRRNKLLNENKETQLNHYNMPLLRKQIFTTNNNLFSHSDMTAKYPEYLCEKYYDSFNK